MRPGIVLSFVAGAVLMGGLAARADAPTTPQCRAGQFAGLDLSTDQQKRLEELRGASHQKVLATREEMFKKEGELRQLWAAQNPDAKAIHAKQAEVDQFRSQLQTARIDYRLAALEVLTPAQREKVQAAGGPGFGLGGCGGGGPGMGGGSRGMRGGAGHGRGIGDGESRSGGHGQGPCGMGRGGDF